MNPRNCNERPMLFPDNPSACSSCACRMCSCERAELIRNGGFEIEGHRDQPLEYWTVVRNVPEASVEWATTVLYEGNAAAAFESQSSTDSIFKSASVRQAVGVTPGCIYQLSFAENFLRAPTGLGLVPMLTARVYYLVHEVEFEMIRIPITKVSYAIDENKGYSFHARTSNRPVPCDVSGVIVQFDFTVQDTGGTRWLLDGVSLRAVSPTSAC